MRNQKIAALVLGITLIIASFAAFTGQNDPNQVKAEILAIDVEQDGDLLIKLALLEQVSVASPFEVKTDATFVADQRDYRVGDKVMVANLNTPSEAYISDFYRLPQIAWLFVLFILAALVVTGWQGIGALVGMGLSFVVIFKLILPLILTGTSPIWAAILGAILIIPLTFYPSHGFNKKTNIAIVSTLATLIIAGVLGAIFVKFTHITGLSSEELNFLRMDTASKIDFQGMILAGILISILGVLDDITISQASIVQQLKLAKKKIKFTELFARAMAVGRDHIASLVNTLILVYAGASLPLLLLFMDQASVASSVINLEFVSEEILRTLVGSIALILAVPITTLLAAQISVKGVVKGESEGCCGGH